MRRGQWASTLRSPTLDWAVAPRSPRSARGHRLILREVVEATYSEPLTGQADEVFDHYIDQGLADALRHAEPGLRETVLAVYQDRYREAAEDGIGQQHLLFATWSVA